ncbi:RcnB family protein [Ramlibacter sp. AN1133]|uniref:RcnB family protein n=1 Tax=Ramlibacter sp. AN1133 TaxID=3133429 RepID=UPI0030C3A72C
MKLTKNTLFAALLAAVAVGPALADGGHGHGHGHGRGHDDRDRDEVRVIERRVVIAEPRHVNRACPPGLARKHNGCLPPGHAHRVVVGQALPPGAVFVVPQRVRSTLPPPPAGYRYAVVDNQVVLVSNNNLVVDILRSLIG